MQHVFHKKNVLKIYLVVCESETFEIGDYSEKNNKKFEKYGFYENNMRSLDSRFTCKPQYFR